MAKGNKRKRKKKKKKRKVAPAPRAARSSRAARSVTRSTGRMRQEIPGVKPVESFRSLGGRSVSADEVQAELSRLSLLTVLDALAFLSLKALQEGTDFYDPTHQRPALLAAIADGFPCPLSGRVEVRSGIFISEHAIAWLSHQALLHCRREDPAPAVTKALMARMFRLVLIANDLLDSPPEPSAQPSNLARKRQIALDTLRHYQFDHCFKSPQESIRNLSRQRLLLCKYASKHFDVDAAFQRATGGVSLQRYFEILGVVWSVAMERLGEKTGERYINRRTFVSELKANTADLDAVLGLWTRKLGDYAGAVEEWRQSYPGRERQDTYDLVVLRQRPLIDIGHDALFCPSFGFLVSKAADEPYFLVSDLLSETKDMTRFQNALGHGYEDYVHELLERVASKDTRGPWKISRSPQDGGAELADTYLKRGEVAVCFEHKASRVSTAFLCGGEGDRVLGPSEHNIARLDRGEAITLAEGKCDAQGAKDDGVLTRPMWQQSIAGPQLQQWGVTEQERPKRIFPVITLLEPLRVHYSVYLGPLIAATPLYSEPFWRRPEWLHVSDIEALAALADDGKLDLEQLLEERQPLGDVPFDYYLAGKNEHSLVPTDARLRDESLELLRSAVRSFFGKDLVLPALDGGAH